MQTFLTNSKTTYIYILVTSITVDNDYLSNIWHVSYEVGLCLLMCFHKFLNWFNLLFLLKASSNYLIISFEKIYLSKRSSSHPTASVKKSPLVESFDFGFENMIWLSILTLYIHLTSTFLSIMMSLKSQANMCPKKCHFRSYPQYGRKMALFIKLTILFKLLCVRHRHYGYCSLAIMSITRVHLSSWIWFPTYYGSYKLTVLKRKSLTNNVLKQKLKGQHFSFKGKFEESLFQQLYNSFFSYFFHFLFAFPEHLELSLSTTSIFTSLLIKF